MRGAAAGQVRLAGPDGALCAGAARRLPPRVGGGVRRGRAQRGAAGGVLPAARLHVCQVSSGSDGQVGL